MGDKAFEELLAQRRRDKEPESPQEPPVSLALAAGKFADGFAIIAAWLAKRNL